MASDTKTPLQRIVDVLKLGEPSQYRDHTYINGESMYFPTGRVYGGQVISQSLIAASKTVPEDRLPHSIHGYFIAPGDIHQDLLFDVENLRDGHSFSARRVNVTQSQGSILTAIASFQTKDQPGVEYFDPMPADVPDPESLPSSVDLMKPYADQSDYAKYYATTSPFDIRYISSPIVLGPDEESHRLDTGKQMLWMRAMGEIEVSQTFHRALLALGCDQVMLEPILRRAGLTLLTPGISFASIDHSMWWYRDIDVHCQENQFCVFYHFMVIQGCNHSQLFSASFASFFCKIGNNNLIFFIKSFFQHTTDHGRSHISASDKSDFHKSAPLLQFLLFSDNL